MARRTKKTETAMTKYEEQLAAAAAAATETEASVASGQFFGLRGGQLTFDDAPMPNNEMAVVIADYVMENVYYEGEYNPDEPQGPVCFAFGRSDKELAPHPDAVAPQSETCAECEHNQWGSARTGRGKACRNTRRIAMIPAGELEGGDFEPYDNEHFVDATQAFMKIPVTSVKGFSAFVKNIAGVLKRPPHGIFTKVSVVPDPKTQFKVQFTPLGEIPNDLLPTIFARNEEIAQTIDFPYTPPEVHEEEEAPKQQRRKSSKKTTRKKSSRR